MSRSVNSLRPAVATTTEVAFSEVVQLIQAARQRVARAANAEVIKLYWRIGQYLHQRIDADGWAKGTVEQLAAYIAQREPGRRGLGGFAVSFCGPVIVTLGTCLCVVFF